MDGLGLASRSRSLAYRKSLSSNEILLVDRTFLRDGGQQFLASRALNRQDDLGAAQFDRLTIV